MSLSDLAKKEPVLVSSGVTAAVGYVGSLLVLSGAISNTQASAVTETVVPTIVMWALALIGFIVRQFVSPAAVKAEGFIAKEVDKYVPELDSAVKSMSGAVNDALAVLDPNASTRLLPKVTGSAPVTGA